MNKNETFTFKRLLVVLTVCLLAVSMLFTVACSNDGADSSTTSSSSSSSSAASKTKTDYQVVTNGDFEFGTDEKKATEFPVKTSVSWTNSSDSLRDSADSSGKSSGIIDTTDEVYNQIASSQKFPADESAEGGYFNPRTPDYYGLVASSAQYVYNEDEANTDKLPTKGNKVLMIHNVYMQNGNVVEAKGTAQKFTSTKTFDVTSYGKVSVWVLTKDLKTKQITDEFGAYIALRTTISEETDPIVLKNINTNGEWVRFDFYVAAHNFASTQMRVVLGLGFGSADYTAEYVEGFAYFDNVTYTELSKAEYEEARTYSHEYDFYGLDNEPVEAKELKFSYNALAKQAVPANEDGGAARYDFKVNCGINTNKLSFTSMASMISFGMNDNYYYADANYGADVECGTDRYILIKDNAALAGVENPFGNEAETAYVIHPTPASSYMKISGLSLLDGQIAYISFYAKAYTEMNLDGLSISVTDKGASSDTPTSLISAFTTTKIDDPDYNNFVKVELFVTNVLGDGKTRNFDLTFNFGKTSDTENYQQLSTGYMLLTNVELAMLSEDAYAMAEDGTYSAQFALGADKPNGVDEEKNKDSYTFSYSAADNTTIMNTPATNVMGYTGVVGGHVRTGGSEENNAFTQDGTIAGVINTKYIDGNSTAYSETAYADLDAEKAALVALPKAGENEYVQPLVIKNVTALTYGYIGTARTFSAGTTTLVSVKVKVLGDATAYVYLTNAQSLSNYEVLTLSAKTYAYDATAKTLTVGDEKAFSKEFVQTVTAADCVNGWATVSFLVTAGNEDISYRVELWNGTRDGATASQGTVVFDEVTTSTLSSTTEFMAKLAVDAQGEEPETQNYTRIPTLVKYSDGSDNTYDEYEEGTVFTKYAAAKTIIATYETIDVETERTITSDDETEDEEESSTTDANTPGTDIGLQIASIIIALVLVAVLVIVALRMLLKNTKKAQAASATYYNRDTRERAQQQINENKAKREAAARKAAQAQPEQQPAAPQTEEPVEEPVEEEPAAPEYDYENPENNIPADAQPQGEPEEKTE